MRQYWGFCQAYNESMLNGKMLKWIAMICMVVDHAGIMIHGEHYALMRTIGRIAFPIFVFQIVEGVFHTKDWKKYLGSLAVFAIISEPCHRFAIHSTSSCTIRNIYFTLTIGAAMIFCFKWLSENLEQKWLAFVLEGILLVSLSVFMGWIEANYEAYGMLIFAGMYYLKKYGLPAALPLGYVLYQMSTLRHGFAVFSLIPIFLYNGERGNIKYKYFYYFFYPVHLVLLKLITG